MNGCAVYTLCIQLLKPLVCFRIMYIMLNKLFYRKVSCLTSIKKGINEYPFFMFIEFLPAVAQAYTA